MDYTIISYEIGSKPTIELVTNTDDLLHVCGYHLKRNEEIIVYDIEGKIVVYDSFRDTEARIKK